MYMRRSLQDVCRARNVVVNFHIRKNMTVFAHALCRERGGDVCPATGRSGGVRPYVAGTDVFSEMKTAGGPTREESVGIAGCCS